MSKTENKIGEILIKKKYITRTQLEHALENQEDLPVGKTLVKMGYVKDEEISTALEHQSTVQMVREEFSNALRNPVQHKILWFIVVFAIIGIVAIYSIVTGSVDQNIGANTNTNIAQNEDINANTVKQKKLRLRYIGHNSKLNEIQDTTSQIKKRANIFKKNTRSSIKSLEAEILDNTELMVQQDSINASDIDDVKTSFEASRAAQKLANDRVKKDTKDLLERLNTLETEINALKEKLKK